MTQPATFSVTTPDGVTHERFSSQPYTHALIVNYAAAWQVHGWYTSQSAAEHQRKLYLLRKTFQPEAMQVVAVEAVSPPEPDADEQVAA